DRVFAALSGCDRLYHVAATYSLDERRKGEILADAKGGAEATLEAARRAGLRKIVMTSSTATLGASADQALHDESSRFNLDDPNAYSQAKWEAENVALGYAERGLPVVIVNPAVILGPGDWKPTPGGRRLVTYLGYSPSFRVPFMPGGFSYVDVDDVAQGHLAAMDKGIVGQRYILGGENLSEKELYQLLSDVTGLAEPGDEVSRGKAEILATVAELVSRFNGQPPLLTRKFVRNYY